MQAKFSSSFSKAISLLRTKRFGTFWFASLLSNIGTWAQQVAQPWLLLSLGASSFLIGLDAFALSAPVWFLTMIGGVLADSGDRRRVIVKFQSLQMMCPILIVILVLSGSIKPWIIISLSLIVGITDALSMPSFQSIVPSFIERSQIASGLALNSTQFNISRILGPAIAGLLLVSVGIVGCFAVSAISYIPFIAVAIWILPRQGNKPYSKMRFNPHEIWAHIIDITKIPMLRGALVTVFISSLLCAPIITFSPVLIKDYFHGDSSQFSMAIGAFGIGGLIGAIGLLFLKESIDRRFLCAWAAGGFSLVLVLTAINPWFWGLTLLLILAGISTSICNISANTLIQAQISSQLRGQAVSLFMLALRGGLAIGSLVTGISISFWGIDHAFMLNGAIALLLHLMIGKAWLKATHAT